MHASQAVVVNDARAAARGYAVMRMAAARVGAVRGTTAACSQLAAAGDASRERGSY
jgi:hypothetical protein